MVEKMGKKSKPGRQKAGEANWADWEQTTRAKSRKADKGSNQAGKTDKSSGWTALAGSLKDDLGRVKMGPYRDYWGNGVCRREGTVR